MDLADLVIGDRAARVAGEGAALELLDVLDLVFQVGADQKLVVEWRADAIHRDGNGKVLFDGVEIGRGDAAADDLEAVLSDQRQRIGRAVEVRDLDLDALFLEVALLDGDHRCRRRDRKHLADLDGFLLRLRGGSRTYQCGADQKLACQAAHRLEIHLLYRQPGSLLSLFSSSNGPSFFTASST
jgi:hypothetical protein